MISANSHSKATAAAAIRGGATRTLDTVGMPTVSISLTPWGSQAEVAFMVSAWAAPTRWITNCPVAWTLRRVSLRLPSSRRLTLTIRVGGSSLITWKKLNGARLLAPSADRVETQAIGRGVTVEANQR